VEFVALTDTLTDTSEHRDSTRTNGDVIDDFHRKDGLTDTSTTDDTDLATFDERGEEIEHLQAGFKHVVRAAIEASFLESRREYGALWHFIKNRLIELRLAVDRPAHRVPHASDHFFANWNFEAMTATSNGDAFLDTVVATDIETYRRVAMREATDKQR